MKRLKIFLRHRWHDLRSQLRLIRDASYGYLFVAAILVMLFVLIILLVSLIQASYQMYGETWWNLLYTFLLDRLQDNNPGFLFTFAFASLSALGIWIALQQLHQILMRVSTLERFLIHASEILELSLENGESKKDKQSSDLYIMCHSPLIGNLSVRDGRAFKRFHGLLRDVKNRVQANTGNITLHLISLDAPSLAAYYNSFSNDPRYRGAVVNKALGEVCEFFRDLSQATVNRRFDWYGTNEDNKPSLFLVCNNRMALVGSLVNLPRLGSPVEGKYGVAASDIGKVEIIGYATQDVVQIESLIGIFYNFVSLQAGRHVDSLNDNLLKELCQN